MIPFKRGLIVLAIAGLTLSSIEQPADARRRRGFRSRDRQTSLVRRSRSYYQPTAARSDRPPINWGNSASSIGQREYAPPQNGYLSQAQADYWRKEYARGQSDRAVQGRLGRPTRDDRFKNGTGVVSYEIQEGKARRMNILYEVNPSKCKSDNPCAVDWWLQSNGALEFTQKPT
jgi:hypothetical protein